LVSLQIAQSDHTPPTMLRFLAVLAALPISLCIDPERFAHLFAPAFEFVEKAWGEWTQASPSKEWPSIEMDIIDPKVGLKQSPAGVHPAKYLQELPELEGFSVKGARINYVNKKGDLISISSHSDWHMFFQSLEGGHSGRLKLKFPKETVQETGQAKTETPTKDSTWWSAWSSTKEALMKVSEKMRTFGKKLLDGQKVEEADLHAQIDALQAKGFSDFDGRGLIFEELGYTKSDWDELIDTMVDYGVPEKWSKSLKLAAKARRGSVKSLMASSFKNGKRTMMYMKFQVFPDGNDGIDGFFAIYKLDATTQEEQTTSPKTEQTFKKYVEMDAHNEWKREVKQYLALDKNEL